MSDYSLQVTWSTKDALSSGAALKGISATELGNEFSAIATAVATKYDSTDRDAANGLAPLDASSLVPVANLPAATTSAKGVAELATSAETITGTDTARVVTPDGLQAVLDQNAGVLTDISGLTDPGGDRIGFWDDSAGAFTWLTPGTGFSISTTTISLSTDAADIIPDAAVSSTVPVGFSSGALTYDPSSLTAFTSTSPVDLDADKFILEDGGTTSKLATAASLVTPEIGSTVTGTSDTMAETDFGKLTQYSSTSTVTVTLPDGLKTGFWAVLHKTGASGDLVISAATTLHTPGSYTTCSTQYGSVVVFHLGSNVWTAWGQLDS